MDLAGFAQHIRTSRRWTQSFRLLVATLVGLAATTSYSEHIAHEHVARLRDWAVLLVYLAIFFACCAYPMLFRWLVPRWRLLARRARVMLGGLALIAGMLGASAIARPMIAEHQLTITATGQKNPASQGSEVWLEGIAFADGTPIAFEQLQQTGVWEARNGSFVSYQGQPAMLQWHGSANGDVQVRLITHPWSGIAQITWDGSAQNVDLYTPNTASKQLVLSSVLVTQSTTTARIQALVIFIADLCILSLLSLVAGVWFYAQVQRLRGRDDKTTFPRKQTLLLAGVGAIALTGLLTPIFLAEPGHFSPARPVYYLVVWLYSVLVLLVLARLLVRGDVSFLRFAETPPLVAHRSHPLLLGQSARMWAGAALAVVAVAAVLGKQITGTTSHAVWTRIALDSASNAAPPTTLRYGTAPEAVATVDWQPYDHTDIAIRPTAPPAQPLQVLNIQTDQGIVALTQVKLTLGELQGSAIAMPNPAGALLTLPQASRAITLTFAPGSGNADVLWLDQHARATLSNQPTSVALRLPATFQGWALLPPEAIDQLALELPAGQTSYRIRDVTIFTATPQQLNGAANGLPWQAEQCAITAAPPVIVVATAANTTCTVHMPTAQPINPFSWKRLVGVWVALTLGLFAVLWVATLLVLSYQRLAARYQAHETQIGQWLRVHSQHWNIRLAMLVVGAIALVFHLLYATTVRFTFTGDSRTYYDLGSAFATTFRFASMDSVRTPGYPLFIAAMIRLVGNAVFWEIVGQHIALALLAPLTVWAFAHRTSQAVAVLTGIGVACLPALSVAANVLWTEALYTAVTAAALLVYIGRGEQIRGLLLTGMLVGAATMVRPTALLLLVCIIGWVLIQGWCRIGMAARQRFAIIGSVAVFAGYLAIAAPWHIHLWLVRNTFDLSRGQTEFTAWAALVYQNNDSADLPINDPDQATWVARYAWGGDPFALLGYAPHVLKGDTDDVFAYYAESRREALSINADRWRDNVKSAFVYNVAFIPGDTRFIYWPEITSMAQLLLTDEPSNLRNEPGIQPFLDLVDRWQPPQSQLRTTLLSFSLFMLNHWKWIALPALASIILLLLYQQLRVLMPAWLYWMGIVLSSSALGMPAERYTVVVEPVLYMIVIASLCTVVTVGMHRVRSVYAADTSTRRKRGEQVNI